MYDWWRGSEAEPRGQQQRGIGRLAPRAVPSTWPRVALGFVAALALLLAATVAVRMTGDAAPAPPSAATPLEPREARARRVCEATRARVMRGGTVSAADAEGWWVEISLIRPANQGELLALVSPSVLTRDRAGELRLLGAPERSDTSWRVVELDDRRQARSWHSTLTLDRVAVQGYFDADDRAELIRAAQSLALAVHASHAATYARCQHSSSHQVGAWFWGHNPAAALSALIGFMTAYSESPLLHADLTRGNGGGPRPLLELLETVESRAGALTRRELSLWLAHERAALVAAASAAPAAPRTPATAPLHIVFPFPDSNRAARAGLRLARQLGLAPTR